MHPRAVIDDDKRRTVSLQSFGGLETNSASAADRDGDALFQRL
jgi:hypothetical protein